MAANIGNAYVTVMPTTKGFIKTLAGAGSKGGASSGKGFADSFGSSIRGGAIVGAASAAFNKVAGVVSSSMEAAVSRVDTLNNFPKVMQSIGYSADESQAQIQKLSSRLSNLPTRLDAMVSSVQQLAPSSKSLEQATDRALAFNDALLAGGGSAQVQENALAQLTKACSTGKMEMDSWMSIQEAMPGQLDQVAKSMLGADKSASDLYQAMKAGKISVSDFADEIVKLDQEGGDGFDSFARQAENATGGIRTSIANMQNAVTKGVANVIQALSPEAITGPVNLIKSGINTAFGAAVGSIETLKDALSRIAPSIDGLPFDQMRLSSEELAGAFSGLGGSLMGLGGRLVESGAAADVANGAVGLLRDACGAVAGPVSTAARWMGDFVARCSENGAVRALSDVVGGLFDAASDVARALGEMARNLVGAAGGTEGARAAADGFKGALDGLSAMVRGVSDATGWLADHADELTPVLAAATGGLVAFKAATAISSAVESATAAVTAFKKANEASTVAQAALNAVMNLNPFVAVATAVGALVAALAYLFTQTELGRQLWGQLCTFLGGAFQAAGAVVSAVAGGICRFFTETVPAAVNGFIAFFAGFPGNMQTFLSDAVGRVGEWAGSVAQWALDAGGRFLANVVTFFTQLPGKVLAFLSGAASNIASWVSRTVADGLRAGSQFLANVANYFRQLPGKVLASLSGAASNIASWVSRTVNDGIRAGSQFLSNVAGFFSQLPGKIWGFLTSALSKLGSFVSDCARRAGEAGKGFLDGIRGGFDQAVDFVKGIPRKCLDALGNIGNLLLDSGKSLVGGFTDGIQNGFKAATDAVENGIQAIRDFFPFSPAKRGPLSGRGYTTFSGRHMMADWAASIAKAAPEAVRSAVEAASEVSSALAVDAAPVSVAARSGGRGQAGGGDDGRPVVNQVLNFNEPWRSPDQVARAVRLEARYGLAAGC